jgi:hypothetical protein
MITVMSLQLRKMIDRYIRRNVSSGSPKATITTMQHQLLAQILAALDGDHNTSIYDLVVQTLWSQESTHIHHQRSILDQIPDLLDFLSEQVSSQLVLSLVKAASFTYKSKLQNLILKQSGFHFGSNRTGLSQLEGLSITQMGWKIQDLAPNLWTLLRSLSDMEPAHWCTAPAEEMFDEDTEMELADIAMAINGNDDGSDELEGEEAEEEAEEAVAVGSEGATSDDEAAKIQWPDTAKRHYQK